MKSIAVIGSGPAALMAADVVSGHGHSVSIYEKRKSPGRKLLIAGSSGLNITNAAPIDEFVSHYSGPKDFWLKLMKGFSPQDWISHIENLGIKTFEGTSGRYFIEDMKASKFLQAWSQRLIGRGVEFHFGKECVDFGPENRDLVFSDGSRRSFDAVCFALGGGSWEPTEKPLRWPEMFIKKGLAFEPFAPSNVGYKIDWSAEFLKEADGLPLKSIVLSSSKGSRKGDAMITRYGIEGTPVYFVGQPGEVTLDLKPDLSVEKIITKLRAVKENLSPIRRVKKTLGLCPASFALLFHTTHKKVLSNPDLQFIAKRIKSLPLVFGDPQPLEEAISSRGGLCFKELDPDLMIRKCPGFFAAGEMLDWDVPTGGFLIQGCVSQGHRAGQAIVRFLNQ